MTVRFVAPWHVVWGMSGAIMVLPRDGLKSETGKPMSQATRTASPAHGTSTRVWFGAQGTLWDNVARTISET